MIALPSFVGRFESAHYTVLHETVPHEIVPGLPEQSLAELGLQREVTETAGLLVAAATCHLPPRTCHSGWCGAVPCSTGPAVDRDLRACPASLT